MPGLVKKSSTGKAATAAKAGAAGTKKSTGTPSPKKAQSRLAQSDVPAYTLSEALRVPEALRDNYAKGPAAPLDVARVLDMTPTSGPFRMLTGAAVAYGLTDNGAQSNSMIGLTPLGSRIVSPVEEGDDITAMREALLNPRVVREFLEKYDGNALPQPNIALNVIESMGVPHGATERAYTMIMQNAESLALLVDHKDKKYVKLDTPAPALTKTSSGGQPEVDPEVENNAGGSYEVDEAPALPAKPPADAVVNNRVFITHGKNATVVEQIKKILTYGKFKPVVSAQIQTVAKPVPDKVMDDMRSCSAAIVHVGIERVLLDEQGNQHPQINSNVLIEIGAAMALYNRRFVLLVERGVTLPSNLQGLYEVRYEGEALEFDATMKLLEVFSNF